MERRTKSRDSNALPANVGTGAAANKHHLHRSIVFVGMMGSGKTAIGRALAMRLGVAFRDSDAELETAANATIAEIFARDGEAFFRDREAEVIARLLKAAPAVLSTGGGAFMSARNRTAISAHGVSVWLDADLDTLWDRVRTKDSRPLLRTANPRATLAELFEKRVPVYQLADMRVAPRPDFAIEQTTALVIEKLLTRPDILELAL